MKDIDIKKLWFNQIKIINKEFENKTKYLFICYFDDYELFYKEGYYQDSSYLYSYLEFCVDVNYSDFIIKVFKNELGRFEEIRRYYFDKSKNIVVCEIL